MDKLVHKYKYEISVMLDCKTSDERVIKLTEYLIDHKVECHNYYTQFNHEVVSSDAEYYVNKFNKMKYEINRNV